MTAVFKVATPVLAADDVGATAKWYEDHLGFDAGLIPDKAPFVFAILCRDGVEIMIQRCGPGGMRRPEGDWHVYMRTNAVRELYGKLEGKVRIVEPLRVKNYGCLEFAVEDPNGYRIVLSEEGPPA